MGNSEQYTKYNVFLIDSCFIPFFAAAGVTGHLTTSPEVEFPIKETRNTTAVPPTSLPTTNSSQDDLITAALPIVVFAEDFAFYSLSFIIPIGCICNILALVTFCRKRMRTQSSCWYLAALTVADTLVLVAELCSHWLPHYKIYVNWYNEHHPMCVITSYLSMTARAVSSWTIVMFTIERMVCVINPLKGIEKLANTYTAKKIIAAGICVCFFPASFVLILSSVRKRGLRMECTYFESHAHLSKSLSLVWIIFSTFVPVTLICTFNCITLCKLYRMKQQHGDLFAVKNNGYGIRKNRIASMLLTVSTCFVILSTPYLIAFIIDYNQNPGHSANEFLSLKGILGIFRVFYMVNFALPLILCIASGAKFRRELLRWITCSGKGKSFGSSFRKHTTQLSIGREMALRAQRRRSTHGTLHDVVCMETIQEESETKSELQISGGQEGSRF